MDRSWRRLVERLLSPARSELEQALRARERHVAERRVFADERARRITDCERRIDAARAVVFAANDGFVPLRMTELEREWRLLSRPDPDAGLMDLWARVAPVEWVDRKRWRDSEPEARLDAAIALAADVVGVETAESAVRSLGVALEAWGARTGSQIRWRLGARDSGATTELLAEPVRAACEAVSARRAGAPILERAERLEREVFAEVRARFPDRPLLARAVAHAAFADCVWDAAAIDRPSPVAPLRELWNTGYALAFVDTSGTTLELPPLTTSVRE